MKSRLLQIVFILVLGALLIIPRVIAIDRFATVDEPYWLTAGSDFYYALGQRAFANTVYDYHPAVTTMWIIALGMLIYFPQYRGFGQGYFDVYKDTLERFLLSHDHTPLGTADRQPARPNGRDRLSAFRPILVPVAAAWNQDRSSRDPAGLIRPVLPGTFAPAQP